MVRSHHPVDTSQARWLLLPARGYHIHLSTSEPHESVSQREEGVIPPSAYVASRQVGGAALANNDRACSYALAGIALDTAVLGVAIPPVP